MRDMMMRLGLLLIAATLVTSVVAADSLSDLDGTWSGDWMIKGSVPDAVTVRFDLPEHGKLTAQFLSPTPMECTSTSFAPKTRTLTLQATDEKSGQHYTLVGKLSGTEIIGTIDAGTRAGSIRLIKWTYSPRPFR